MVQNGGGGEMQPLCYCINSWYWFLNRLAHSWPTGRGYNSSLRAEISAAEKLALTLRYLATGNSQVSQYLVNQKYFVGFLVLQLPHGAVNRLHDPQRDQ